MRLHKVREVCRNVCPSFTDTSRLSHPSNGSFSCDDSKNETAVSFGLVPRSRRQDDVCSQLHSLRDKCYRQLPVDLQTFVGRASEVPMGPSLEALYRSWSRRSLVWLPVRVLMRIHIAPHTSRSHSRHSISACPGQCSTPPLLLRPAASRSSLCSDGHPGCGGLELPDCQCPSSCHPRYSPSKDAHVVMHLGLRSKETRCNRRRSPLLRPILNRRQGGGGRELGAWSRGLSDARPPTSQFTAACAFPSRAAASICLGGRDDQRIYILQSPGCDCRDPLLKPTYPRAFPTSLPTPGKAKG
ncbi:hypothetical protein FB45DRAFT_243038 [Roridomyces roridus]|uniref:Uncharacterized protein n=1 Tax=Roridomyces roridus TaxID=1738132 RepID=A0AAD7BA37_9AGAR|nr:hypothetical protein FB45DRAFT_243038 [Roridomyces roridus]